MVADLFPQRIGKIGGMRRDETVHTVLDLDACESSWIGDRQAAKANRIHELKDAGVDTDKIDKDLKAKAQARPTDGQPGTDPEIDALLASLGVDPAKFKSALQTAIQKSGNGGSIDLSQVFSSAAMRASRLKT